MTLRLADPAMDVALHRAVARRHRATLKLLRVDWPQGVECLQRTRAYFGDGLIEPGAQRPVVVTETERALAAYVRHTGGDGHARIEALLDALLAGIAGRVAGVRVEAPDAHWVPGAEQPLPAFQHAHRGAPLYLTRDNTADPDALTTALAALLVPAALQRALRWCPAAPASARTGRTR